MFLDTLEITYEQQIVLVLRTLKHIIGPRIYWKNENNVWNLKLKISLDFNKMPKTAKCTYLFFELQY